MSGGERGDEPTKYVGRAKPPPLAPATDPYEPMYDDMVYTYGPPEVERRHRRSGMTVALVVVGVFAACCATGAVVAMLGGAMFRAAADQSTAPPPTTRSAAAPTTRPARTRSGLGTPVRDGKFEFVVRSVSCGHDEVGEKFVNVKATGQFCIVSLTVKNIGDEGQTFADSFQKAHGVDDKIYRAHTGAGVVANEGTNAVWNAINPGLSMTGKIVFDIPKKAELASLELHDSPLSRGATVTIR